MYLNIIKCMHNLREFFSVLEDKFLTHLVIILFFCEIKLLKQTCVFFQDFQSCSSVLYSSIFFSYSSIHSSSNSFISAWISASYAFSSDFWSTSSLQKNNYQHVAWNYVRVTIKSVTYKRNLLLHELISLHQKCVLFRKTSIHTLSVDSRWSNYIHSR